MAGSYAIFGKQIPTYQLSMFFIGGYAALGAASILKPAAPKPAAPPIQASSSDEEAFIKEFLANAEAEEKKN